MESVTPVLERMGLTDKEAAIYLALLEVGTAPASTLGKRTKIVKSTAHFTCQQLVKKGLARVAQKGNSFLFTCEPPEKLLHLVERQRKDLDKRAEEITQILGPLKQMMNPQSVLPKVQYYEGREGMIDLYDHILDMRAPIDSFEEVGRVMDLFPDYIEEFVAKRIERKIHNRCIAPAGSPKNTSDPSKFIDVRHMDSRQYPFTWHVKICKDLVGIFSFDEHAAVGISIRHPDITKNFQLLFEYVWDSLRS